MAQHNAWKLSFKHTIAMFSVCILIMCTIYSTIIQSIASLDSTIMHEPVFRYSCNCLNDIFDHIFVISIKPRYETLSLTLHQLNEENMIYTVWEGHSSDNPHSLQLFTQFKRNIDAKNRSHWYESVDKWSLYYNKNAFFLRQTQVDILKYSSTKNLKQILIFEDDILLANPYWINMFCDVFPPMRRWWIVNIGVNQMNPNQRIPYFRSFRNHSDLAIKFYAKTRTSLGTFAIAFHDEGFEELIDLFDMEGERVNCFPIDTYNLLLNNKRLENRVLNIHPTLVLPDVTTSTLRDDTYAMETFMRERTTDHNISHFSKYWNLRFSNRSDTTSQIERIRATLPSFEELVRHSPSNIFLKKES
eukprot:100683_1